MRCRVAKRFLRGPWGRRPGRAPHWHTKTSTCLMRGRDEELATWFSWQTFETTVVSGPRVKAGSAKTNIRPAIAVPSAVNRRAMNHRRHDALAKGVRLRDHEPTVQRRDYPQRVGSQEVAAGPGSQAVRDERWAAPAFGQRSLTLAARKPHHKRPLRGEAPFAICTLGAV